MAIETRGILISFIIGFIINLVSVYLLYLKTISLNLFIFVLMGSIFIIIIVITQLSSYEIENRLAYQEKNQRKLDEKLKIHEQLIDMKADIKELQREVFRK